jgi:hypothetical protein
MTAMEENSPAEAMDEEANAHDTTDTVVAPRVYKKYAVVTHPIIQAVLGEHFRFDSEAWVESRVAQIRRLFAHDESHEDTMSVRLWIRGLALTEEQEKEGYQGHFAMIRAKKLNPQEWTLSAHLESVELADHPQKASPRRKHPNWAHPVMVGIRKGRTWETVEDAREQLDKLHREYQDVSIPTSEDKLLIIVYSKSALRDMPIQRLALEIVETEDNRFKIDYKERASKKRPLGGSKKAEGMMSAAAMVAASFGR